MPTAIGTLYLHSNATLTGDISGWTLPATLNDFYCAYCTLSGDISGWVIPVGVQFFRIQENEFSGDISGWVLPAGMIFFYIEDNTLSGTPDISGNVSMRSYRYYDNGLIQANVDAILLSVYNRRMGFTWATPALNVGGTNDAPTGTYQAQCPPADGKELAFELVNDSCGDGFILWAVTFTA